MKKNDLRILVEYFDDNNSKHITVVNSFSDVEFLKERFWDRVKYEVIDKSQPSKNAVSGYIGIFIN